MLKIFLLIQTLLFFNISINQVQAETIELDPDEGIFCETKTLQFNSDYQLSSKRDQQILEIKRLNGYFFNDNQVEVSYQNQNDQIILNNSRQGDINTVQYTLQKQSNYKIKVNTGQYLETLEFCLY